jgi:hypothetical protein
MVGVEGIGFIALGIYKNILCTFCHLKPFVKPMSKISYQPSLGIGVAKN